MYNLQRRILRRVAVCRSWRRIVLSTPRLWTKFSFRYCKAKAEGQCQLFCDWLRHSGDLPVSIKLSINSDNDDYYTEANEFPTFSFMLILNAAKECSYRWKSLATIRLPHTLYSLLCG
ncbi:hypothetical protein CPB84DRAFT_1774627, partial [Gymnopilus junonius]